MRLFFLRLTLVLAINSTIFSADFTTTKEIVLKKDELFEMVVKYGEIEKIFRFRWTLFVNGGLVMHRFYDGEVKQTMLYLRHKNRSFNQELQTQTDYLAPYALVMFKEFEAEKKRARFILMIKDIEQKIELKYLKPKPKGIDAKS